MAISFNELVKSMNNTYKELYDIRDYIEAQSYDYKLELSKRVIEMAKQYHPAIIKFVDEIKFNGEQFYMQYKELPVGIEFYETDEDVGNEFY